MKSFYKIPTFAFTDHLSKEAMGIDILKMLIETACADGLVTPRERLHLEEQAKEHNVSKEELDKLIEKELERVKTENNSFNKGKVINF